MAVIVYDLDHTLIDADCSLLWIDFLYQKKLIDHSTIALAEELNQQYQQGKLDMNDYLEMQLQPHIGQTIGEATAHIQEFLEQYVTPKMRTDALENIRHHKANGDRCIVISASIDFLVKPVAHLFGITESIGVSIELKNQKITGKGKGRICFQEGKIFYFNEWLKQNNENAKGSWFYSDSHNDIPLLQVVDHAVAVSADPQLIEAANQNGWQVVNW